MPEAVYRAQVEQENNTTRPAGPPNRVV